jgi:hypothetical protein
VSRSRWVERMASLGLGLVLAMSPAAPAAPPGQPKAPLVPSKQRSFRIPFNIDPADRPRYKQVQLWVSSDNGEHWEKVDTTTPDRPSFTFKAPRDGEFWFAVRTLDVKNRLIPADDADVEPNMKVLVDTVPPKLTLEGLPRRGSIASVRWEVIDDRLDLGSFLLEYQTAGASEWSQVPIRRPTRVGRETWDAGTAEALKVRMTVADKVGNSKAVSLQLPDGLPRGDTSFDPSDPTVPPPRGTFASSESERSSPPPIQSGPPPMPAVGSRADAGRSSSSGSFNPFQPDEAPARAAPSRAEPPDPSNPPIQVSSPKFGLKYEVDDAGPNGPAAVELFVTTDGGRTWFSRGEDPDRASPFPVDLGGEGTFGLKLVAKSAANQGDQPPVPGEVPRTIVEVDASPPNVKLEAVKISGSRAVITWQANDPHPVPRPVMISVKSDAAGSNWQSITPTPIENTGQFTWTLPASCPARLHFRVDVVDSLGNRGLADTTETGAVLVDRSRPKGRIIGLDAGNGPTARPIQ